MKEQHPTRETDKTLASLDGLNPADPGPYFYTRLTGRMESRQQEKAWAMPLVWKAALTVLVLVNGLTLYLISAQDTTQDTTDPVEMLSADYFNTDEDLYLLEYTQAAETTQE